MCVAWLIRVGNVWRVAGWIRAYVRLSRVWGVVLPLCCMDERSWVMMRGEGRLCWELGWMSIKCRGREIWWSS